MSYWQTLALAAQDAQRGGEAYGQGMDLALKRDSEERKARSEMMDLALKDALHRPKYIATFADMLKSVSTPNEARINRGITLATDPFARVTQNQSLGEYQEDPELLNLRRELEKPLNQGYATDREIGVGGRTIEQGYRQGGEPGKPAIKQTREQKQNSAIDKLRGEPGRSPQGVITPEEWGRDNTFYALLDKVGGEQARLVKNGFMFPWHVQAQNLSYEEQTVFDNLKRQMRQSYWGDKKEKTYNPASRAPGRSPQSEGSIVQPLEGPEPLLPQQIVRPLEGNVRNFQGEPVMNLEPEIIRGNPDEEAALTHIMGKFADLRNPEYGEIANGMMHPVLQERMLGAMIKNGYIPGLGLQTEATEKRMAALDQGQIMAAKTSTQMSQEAQQFQMKLEEQRLMGKREELMKMRQLAVERGLKDTQQRIERSMKEVDQKLRAWEQSKPPAPRSRGSSQDPLAKAYIDRLKNTEASQRRFAEKMANEFAGLDAGTIREFAQADPMLLADYNILAGLWNTGKKFPNERAVFEDFFRAGNPNIDLNQLFGSGGSSSAPSPTGRPTPPPKSGPKKGDTKQLPSGKMAVFNGSQWVPQ